jgi:glucosamine--fructose-6-phosphate aminotransferase (isomerizing)
MEAALKFKETCGIQAEAFSGAEIQHGPMALIDEGYPLLLFAPRGPAQAGLLEAARGDARRGARVLLAAPPGTPERRCRWWKRGCRTSIRSAPSRASIPWWRRWRGRAGNDPDQPPHLKKVTRTS